MKRFFCNRGFVVLALIMAAFAGVSLLTGGNGFTGGFLESYVFMPVQKLISSGARTAENTLAPEKSREELESEISRLSDENRRLYDMLSDHYEVKAENEVLLRFYDIKKQVSPRRAVIGAVISRDPKELYGGFTLDKGGNDGVCVNDAVVTENGLVGMVGSVTPRSCVVKTLFSPELSIGASVKRTGDSGIICGSSFLSGTGLTKMINLPADHKIQPGDFAVTSDYGTVLPGNIKIGVVTEILSDEYSGLPYALIKPFESAEGLCNAMIVSAEQ